ncbi:hypothetical protein BG005_007670 [Podila minutissima]|nr:hypothetical protein BG005_007670 [Podila minutissima]
MFTNPIARLVSLPNATRMLRTLPKRAFSGTTRATNSSFFTNNNFAASPLAHRFTASKAAQEPVSSRFFSSSTAPNRFTSPRTSTPFTSSSVFSRTATKTTSPHLQGKAIRTYYKGAEDAADKATSEHLRRGWFRGGWHRHQHRLDHEAHLRQMREYWSRCGSRHHYHHMRHRRRPFIRRMVILSTLFVAVPAVVAFDAPCSTLIMVPLAVGGGLLLTRSLLFFVLPVAIVGGAAAFWVVSMPAVTTVKDLKKILKRNEQGDFVSALNALGPNWTVQAAKPDEWFRWTFPETVSNKNNDKPAALDKVDIRVGVFDPKDQSEGKIRMFKFLDRIQDSDEFKKCRSDSKCSKTECVENLQVRRDENHIVITMEDNGEKIMEQEWAKKYLELGQIVDRAASELEARQPGKRLGEQVVLVHKNKDSFWNRFSPYGDLSLRIPFNRTWLHDLSDE